MIDTKSKIAKLLEAGYWLIIFKNLKSTYNCILKTILNEAQFSILHVKKLSRY